MIIAQVTDIHAAQDNDNLSRFERALAWLDLIEPDALVLTGDLIDDDWRDGYTAIATPFNAQTHHHSCRARRTVARCFWPSGRVRRSQPAAWS